MKIYTAPDGKVYQNKFNGITAKTLIIGKRDSIDNYELMPEPVEENEQEVEDNDESDVSV